MMYLTICIIKLSINGPEKKGSAPSVPDISRTVTNYNFELLVEQNQRPFFWYQDKTPGPSIRVQYGSNFFFIHSSYTWYKIMSYPLNEDCAPFPNYVWLSNIKIKVLFHILKIERKISSMLATWSCLVFILILKPSRNA